MPLFVAPNYAMAPTLPVFAWVVTWASPAARAPQTPNAATQAKLLSRTRCRLALPVAGLIQVCAELGFEGLLLM